jgi:transposase-like protein
VFSAAEKVRIVKEAASCSPGEQAALLRREGIYSSHLSTWRRQLEHHGAAGLSAAKRGKKVRLDPKDRRILELEQRLAAAQKELEVRQALIELQKKVSELLGGSFPGTEES